jgi:hypothetical protein
VQIIRRVLLLHDLHGPKALDTLLFGVGVALVAWFIGGIGVDFLDAQGEKREREQFEDVLCFGAVRYGREEGVFGAGFFVGWGFNSADGTFYYSSC